jgi:hypothetical protein
MGGLGPVMMQAAYPTIMLLAIRANAVQISILFSAVICSSLSDLCAYSFESHL